VTKLDLEDIIGEDRIAMTPMLIFILDVKIMLKLLELIITVMVF
jgi:hypothetical protein